VNATEEWRPVVGHEALYEVSSLGRVRSVDRVVPHSLYGTARLTGRILKQQKSPAATYASVGFGSHGKYYVHRLVLDAFVGPKPEGMVSCHANGDHLDNRIENLRYDTYSANIYDAVRHGTYSNGQSKKTHCIRHHEFTPENTHVRGDGKRQCKECNRMYRATP
jgi:hypothetical protein